MRLLRTDTLEFEEFFDAKIPEYAILSHTWGPEEVTHQQFLAGGFTHRAGYQKISKCCELARNYGLQYAWIDTCCIDKKSSAELSEAINSMYRWYEKSIKCYVFLDDVAEDTLECQAFEKCRWITRGFTLQELIAPSNVEFFNSSWKSIGHKREHYEWLYTVTGINQTVLLGRQNPHFFPVAARMSWAASRETSRVEDVAYCLFGLFNISMPLLYGEGAHAFRRLQEEIMRQSDDYTLFAWEAVDSPVFQRYCEASATSSPFSFKSPSNPANPLCHLLALHPSAFASTGSVQNRTGTMDVPNVSSLFQMGNRGISIHILVGVAESEGFEVALLPCFQPGPPRLLFGIYIARLDNKDTFARAFPHQLRLIDHDSNRDGYLQRSVVFPNLVPRFSMIPKSANSLSRWSIADHAPSEDVSSSNEERRAQQIDQVRSRFLNKFTFFASGPGLIGAMLVDGFTWKELNPHILLLHTDDDGCITHCLAESEAAMYDIGQGDPEWSSQEWFNRVRLTWHWYTQAIFPEPPSILHQDYWQSTLDGSVNESEGLELHFLYTSNDSKEPFIPITDAFTASWIASSERNLEDSSSKKTKLI